MTVSNNTIQAERLDLFFKNSVKKRLKVSKKVYSKILTELLIPQPKLLQQQQVEGKP